MLTSIINNYKIYFVRRPSKEVTHLFMVIIIFMVLGIHSIILYNRNILVFWYLLVLYRHWLTIACQVHLSYLKYNLCFCHFELTYARTPETDDLEKFCFAVILCYHSVPLYYIITLIGHPQPGARLFNDI